MAPSKMEQHLQPSVRMVDTQARSFANRTAEIRACVDAALDRYTAFPSGCPETLTEAIRYSLLASGKRLRPILVVMAAEACGGRSQAALPAACAVEMVHTYSLIHDDLPAMDNDDLRRGQPTCHKKFGEAVAILAGDALLALAFEVLANGIHPPAVAAACCAALGEAAGPRHLVGGQADDIRGGACMASIAGAGPESGVVAEDRQAPQAGLEALESVHAQDRRDDPGLGATGRIDRGGRRRTDVGIGAIRPACGAGISNR